MFKKILAVDDSDIVLNLHQMTFRRHPEVDLLTARNGIEALKKLKEHNDVELVLLDINMPLMDGITFLDLMKKDEKFAPIPVIMISTEGEEDSVATALRKGAIAYIKKPFRQRELFELLDQVEKRVNAG